MIGRALVDGQPSCNVYSVGLNPADQETAGRLDQYLDTITYSAGQLSDPNHVQHFEWWDPYASDGPCYHGRPLTPTQGTNEFDPLNPTLLEHHCIVPGRYNFTFVSDAFTVEYLQAGAENIGPFLESVEAVSYSPTNSVHDLVINRDVGTGSYSDSPQLDIQNSGSSPYATYFSNQSNPSGTKDDWFRFSTARSTSTYPSGRGNLLARLYWDWPTNPSDKTDFYDASPTPSTMIRLHKFPNPTTASKQYTVGLELMRPDEEPASGPSVTRTVTITRINPNLKPGTITGPGSASTGTNISVSIQERNTVSTAAVEAGWAGRIYLSLDTVLNTGSDSLIGAFTETDSIAASGSKTASRSAYIPAGLASGSYYILAYLDYGNAVLETSEADNLGHGASLITISTSTGPTNFRVSSCTAGSSYIDYTVDWTPASGYLWWDIADATVNDPNQSTIIKSGKSHGTTISYIKKTNSYRYLWVRQRNLTGAPTAWVALYENPLDLSGCIF